MALIAAIFPSIQGSANFDELVESYPDALKSLFGISSGATLGSGAGFLDAELFSFMLPLLVLVLAIGTGTRAFAGEEDAGRLELVLAYPVRRSAAVVADGVALAAQVVLLAAFAGAAMLVLDPIFGLDLDAARALAAVGGVALLGVFYGWLALGVGAATGKRALAVALAAGLAAGGYLVAGLHDLASWLDPFRFLSPFWWLGSSPLQNGVRASGVVVVAIAALAVLAAGAFFAERRDLEAP